MMSLFGRWVVGCLVTMLSNSKYLHPPPSCKTERREKLTKQSDIMDRLGTVTTGF